MATSVSVGGAEERQRLPLISLPPMMSESRMGLSSDVPPPALNPESFGPWGTEVSDDVCVRDGIFFRVRANIEGGKVHGSPFFSLSIEFTRIFGGGIQNKAWSVPAEFVLKWCDSSA